MTWILSLIMGFGVPARFAKPVAIIGGIVLLISILGVGKCAYDRSVIAKHEQKAQLEQAKRERKADANLQTQKSRDDAAAQQRREEIDNATHDIPDQAPSARQRARVCLELQRQAKQRGKPAPAC